MKIKIKLNEKLDNVPWEILTRLFEKVNWGYRSPEDIRNSFSKSAVCVFAYDNEELIGFGRTIDDGMYYALIVDLVVNPSYQGKGIGAMVVNTIRAQLNDYKFVTLTSAPGKDGFYKKMGWKKQSSSFIWPVDEQQKLEHCEIER